MTNWKYTKGSEKDFEGAPDWSKFLVKGSMGVLFFVEFMGYGGLFTDANLEAYSQKPSKISGLYINGEVLAQREPVAEWDCKKADAINKVM